MKIQVLSDLHLETEEFAPEPHPEADLLILAGDIDTTWEGLRCFNGWPVPVIMVAGNHEFDRRELNSARAALRQACEQVGIRLLECETLELADRDGRRVRFLGTTRWCDFDAFGAQERDKALRAATYFVKVMRSTCGGRVLDAQAVRELALQCRAWLKDELGAVHGADATVVVTHYAPSLLSADPRYGLQASTASFCNADDDLMRGVDLWIHGHLHLRHDYQIDGCRVISQARGLRSKAEDEGFDPWRLVRV